MSDERENVAADLGCLPKRWKRCQARRLTPRSGLLSADGKDFDLARQPWERTDAYHDLLSAETREALREQVEREQKT